MDDRASTIPFLFTVHLAYPDGQEHGHRSFVFRAHSAQEAWVQWARPWAGQVLVQVQDEEDRAVLEDEEGFTLPAARFHLSFVTAISCDEEFAQAYEDAADMPELWEEDLARERGAVLIDEHGQLLPGWRDRGPLQIRQAVTVLEYRGLVPGSPGMLSDPVRWSDVEVDSGLAAGGDLLVVGEEQALRFERGDGVVDSEGVVRPNWIAPGSDGYTGESRYLVRWVFDVANHVDVEALYEECGDSISAQLLEMEGDVGEDPDEGNPYAVEVQMQSARESLLQELLERTWRPSTPAGADPAEAEAPEAGPEVAGFTMLLPYDPRSVAEMMPGPDRRIGQITAVMRTTIVATDPLEWPALAGFVGEPGYRVTCALGTPDGEAWSRHEGLWSRLTERFRQARAAVALARLEELVEVSEREPAESAAQDAQIIADLRTADGHGRIYLAEPEGTVHLIEHTLAGTFGWRLLQVPAKTVRALVGNSDDPWIPRYNDPALGQRRNPWAG
ncbi:hypothetical protein GCM10011374_30400 [Kocuria dechangensis]|uniref:Uncharacterized protein n=1 Tax=Kocuria dechangensis TaxID=1176249 RepID=A0A917LY16_9MICC|nr:hypothetical protein [Kocuria dechangensis]GGG64642.1 hypothetical protein GCM10011374_30400 [Kocuria dechangensis]